MVILTLRLLPLTSRLQQGLHQQPSQTHVPLEPLPNRPKMPPSHLLLPCVLLHPVVLPEVGKCESQRPVGLIQLDLPQRAWFLVGVQKVDEVDELQDDVRDLEVVQDHIVFHHVPQGAVAVVEDQAVPVPRHLLLRAHVRRHHPVAAAGRTAAHALPPAVVYCNAVEAEEVGAGVGLELVEIEQEGIYLCEWEAGVGVYQVGAVVEAGPMQAVAPLLRCLGGQFPQKFNLLVITENVLLDLLLYLCDVLLLSAGHELIDHCVVLLPF